MMLIKSFFLRIITDFRHKELLPLKLIFFVQASTLYVLYPYLTIHMRELGINVEETAIMSAITPFVAIIMPPLAGLFADRIGNFKILLSLFSSLGGAAALLLLLVPVGRVTLQFPQRVVMELGCTGAEGELIYTMSQYHPCETKLQPNISTRIESCGYTCNVDSQNETDLQAMLAARSWTVTYADLDQAINTSYSYDFPANDLAATPKSSHSVRDIREDTQMKNNELYKISVRRVSRSSYFFPADQLHEFRCTRKTIRVENPANSTVDDKSALKRDETICEFDKSATASDVNSSAIEYLQQMTKLRSIESNYIDRLEKKRRYLVEEISLSRGENLNGVKCQNPDSESRKISMKIALVNWTVSSEPYKYLQADGCSKRCVVTAPRADVCSNMDTVVEYNVVLTFWLYLAIRVFIGMIGGTAFAMFEGAVIAILREQEADYGMQRIYGSIGGMISSPLSGMLIDYASRGKSYTDFRPAFYLYAGLKIASGVLMLAINLEFKSPANNVVSDVVSVLKNVEIVALLLACFVLGTAWGYIESFLFWLLQDLGGSRSLMGITITVGGIAGIPLLVFSGPIIQKIGHANVLFIGFIFYAVRLLGYSLIYNPWLSLIFEALESVTASLSFTAAVTYAAKLSTTSTDSSIQGLLGGVYYGVGRGSGSLIGGYLMKTFGTRPTYQIFAVVSLVTGFVYFLFNALYLKKRPQIEGNDIVKKKPKKISSPDQNGIENGDIDLAVRNEKKKLEADGGGVESGGIQNEAFAGNIDDLETINNAKNLDRIEKLPDCDKTDSDKRSEIPAEDSLPISKTDEERTKATKRSKEVCKGVDNPSFAKESTGSNLTDAAATECNVTVERQPDDDDDGK